MSDSFAGIAPANVLSFIIAQLIGGLAATLLFVWLVPRAEEK
jgi:glycerol uptake facilitator-like aquaporin